MCNPTGPRTRKMMPRRLAEGTATLAAAMPSSNGDNQTPGDVATRPARSPQRERAARRRQERLLRQHQDGAGRRQPIEFPELVSTSPTTGGYCTEPRSARQIVLELVEDKPALIGESSSALSSSSSSTRSSLFNGQLECHVGDTVIPGLIRMIDHPATRPQALPTTSSDNHQMSQFGVPPPTARAPPDDAPLRPPEHFRVHHHDLASSGDEEEYRPGAYPTRGRPVGLVREPQEQHPSHTTTTRRSRSSLPSRHRQRPDYEEDHIQLLGLSDQLSSRTFEKWLRLQQHDSSTNNNDDEDGISRSSSTQALPPLAVPLASPQARLSSNTYAQMIDLLERQERRVSSSMSADDRTTSPTNKNTRPTLCRQKEMRGLQTSVSRRQSSNGRSIDSSMFRRYSSNPERICMYIDASVHLLVCNPHQGAEDYGGDESERAAYIGSVGRCRLLHPKRMLQNIARVTKDLTRELTHIIAAV